jgi:[ribosomal protein S18]-alanine N-acetyltransferase
VTAERGYGAVTRGGELVGKCCFGAPARVPQMEEEGTLDVGYGLHPDLVGNGFGPPSSMRSLEFASAEFAPTRFRVRSLDWNRRSQTW